MNRDTLLVIDDSPLDLAILNEIFKHLFHVECFEEARPAIAYIHRNPQRICAVLLDICLGRRGAGFLVLQQLQAAPETVELPVILITTDARQEYVLNAVDKGAADFLVKPVDPQMVQERICAVVRKAWPAGSTVLDAPVRGQEGRSAAPELPVPDQGEHWERLLELFFQARPGLSPAHYRRLGMVTSVLAGAYARTLPGQGVAEEDAELIGRAAMFCDVGLLGVPDAVVEQGPDQEGADREIYYRHTALGHALFATGVAGGEPLARYAAEIAYWHHKNYDGTGIPDAETSEPVPVSAQLTHAALGLLSYLEYFQGTSDCLSRSLRALAGDVGRTISQEMYTLIQGAQEALSKKLSGVDG